MQEGYLGRFNLLQYGENYYALGQKEGGFSIEKFKDKECHECYEGTTLDDVKQAVYAELTSPRFDDSNPILVLEGFKNSLNIIRYQGKYYALDQEEGPFQIEKIHNKQYKRYFVGDSVEDVKRQIP